MSTTEEARATNVIKHNLETDRDATPLFYTEVDGWENYLSKNEPQR